MKNKIFTTSDNARLMCATWDNVSNPIGVIQIVHGVFDCAATYDKFAHFLNQNGYIVFSTDISLSKKPRTFESAVNQEIDIMRHLNIKYDLPLFLIGYGYGGFIVQSMLQNIDTESAGVCLIKSGRHARWKLKMAQLIAHIGMRIYGADATARIVNFFTRRHCGHTQKAPIGTYGFYASLLDGLIKLDKKSNYENPILIICGPNDYGTPSVRLSRALYNSYANNDLTHTMLLMYPDVRDRMLMEINCGAIGDDILSFFNDTNTMYHSNMSANDNGMIF
jgi:alpha-beta hydrolase superfamily lysophospholipase